MFDSGDNKTVYCFTQNLAQNFKKLDDPTKKKHLKKIPVIDYNKLPVLSQVYVTWQIDSSPIQVQNAIDELIIKIEKIVENLINNKMVHTLKNENKKSVPIPEFIE